MPNTTAKGSTYTGQSVCSFEVTWSCCLHFCCHGV